MTCADEDRPPGSDETRELSYYIGWDVGGWNCDRNSKSRDAIVILDADLGLIGEPWRGNLRAQINAAVSTSDWLCELFSLCSADLPIKAAQVTLAIDTPLGFSGAFVNLVKNLEYVEPMEGSGTNPYLFRQTERHLFRRGIKPLSAVKDMIGSQATKGMQVLAKFAPDAVSCGVWTDGEMLTAIEAYPSPCKKSATIQKLRHRYSLLGHEDKEDALTCALIAYLFAKGREVLDAPGEAVPLSEGWIWVPRDAIG